MSSRLGLGTVQFGQPYGIANRSGRVVREEARAILDYARGAGVDLLDTAIAYGDSERLLGELGVKGFKVVTKLPSAPESCTNIAAWVQDAVAGSLSRLGIERLYGLLLHHSADLRTERGAELYGAMSRLKELGAIENVGVSIYSPEELGALDSRFELEIVQAPFSVVDRRLATSGWLEKLNAEDREVHVRSVFLQGLLLMKSDERPTSFGRWQALWDCWDAWLSAEGLAPLRSCLEFVLDHTAVRHVVVGVDSLAQLAEIDAIVKSPAEGRTVPSQLMSDDLDLIEPSRWRCA